MSRVYDPVEIARQFKYVRELPGNHGQRVEALQRWCGGQPGDSWCMFFATFVYDICYQGECPLPREGSCEAVHQLATVKGWLVDAPEPGDLVISINSAGIGHHVGICTVVEPLATIAGNTSQSGASSNGDGVYEHPVDPANMVYVRIPE